MTCMSCWGAGWSCLALQGEGGKTRQEEWQAARVSYKYATSMWSRKKERNAQPPRSLE